MKSHLRTIIVLAALYFDLTVQGAPNDTNTAKETAAQTRVTPEVDSKDRNGRVTTITNQPARIELSGGAELRVVQASDSTGSVSKAGNAVTIILSASAPPSPKDKNENLGEQGANHVPSNWSIFVDGSAAIFGLLSASVTLFVLYLALRGFNDYRALKAQLVEEVKRDVTNEIVNKLVNDAIAGISARVNDEADAIQKRVLEQAEKRLANETIKLATDVAHRDDFKNEISQRVATILSPEMKTTTPDEFDPPATA